jgi:hypothetical protein
MNPAPPVTRIRMFATVTAVGRFSSVSGPLFRVS